MRPRRVPTSLLLLLLLLPGGVAQAVDDATLERSVLERLDRDPRLRSLGLDVDVHRSVAVLRGSVPTLADALEALRVVGEVKGIQEIESRLDLTTRGRPDREIAFELRNRFQHNGDLAAADLAFDVRGGVVLLTGTVIDSRVRSVARRVASTVPGVLGIADEIRGPDADGDVARDGLGRRRPGTH